MSVKKHLKKSGWIYIGESTDEENAHIFEKKVINKLFEVVHIDDILLLYSFDDKMEKLLEGEYTDAHDLDNHMHGINLL